MLYIWYTWHCIYNTNITRSMVEIILYSGRVEHPGHGGVHGCGSRGGARRAGGVLDGPPHQEPEAR